MTETAPATTATDLPQRVLYSTSARIGGTGLDIVAHESLRAAAGAGCLGLALGFENRAPDLPPEKIRSLERHPVRMLSWLMDSEYYYSAKKHAVDKVAARELATGGYDLLHTWSGEAIRSLRVARERGIPSILEIPTWHRHKGKVKSSALTRKERELAEARLWAGFKNRLLVTRQQALEEYDLADLILCLSEKAEETFLVAGIPKAKLFRHHRGVDPERFRPAEQPPEGIFRAVFCGALIERKGVHHLLHAWHKLKLKNAELVLAGTLHSEMEPWLKNFPMKNVKIGGFTHNVEEIYQSAHVHVFPSLCEGSAKVTYEASACGLPQITTSESGDVVVHDQTGIIIPRDEPGAIADALEHLYNNPDLRERMGRAGRQRVLENFTWSHFHQRMLLAYRRAMGQRAV